MNKYKILKKVGLWLFITAFVVNVTMTSYAATHVRINNSAETIVSAAAGGGPFFALVGASLLAAGLVCEAASDDPTDGALEYFVSDCIVNDHFANTALEYIYNNLEIDENGNIDYKQVVTNIQDYVAANNIVISTANAAVFENGALWVAPEVIMSMSKNCREWWSGYVLSSSEGDVVVSDSEGDYCYTVGWIPQLCGDVSTYYPRVYTDINGNYTSQNNFIFLKASDSWGSIYTDIYTGSNLYYSGSSYYALFGLIYNNLGSFGANTTTDDSSHSIYVGYDDAGLYISVFSKDELNTIGCQFCIYLFDSEGELIFNDSVAGGSKIYLTGCNALSWNRVVMAGFENFIGVDDIPYHNIIQLDAVTGDTSLPLRDVYDGVYDDVSTAPVLDIPADNYVVLDDAMVTDLDTAYENVIAVVDGPIDDATDKEQVINDSLTQELTGAIENANERAEATDIPVEATEVGWEDLKTDGLIDKFPFCIPFDLISLVHIFDAEPEAPYIDIPVVVPVIGVSDHIVIDFSKYEYVVEIMRKLEVVGFVLFLVLKTRELIKG